MMFLGFDVGRSCDACHVQAKFVIDSNEPGSIQQLLFYREHFCSQQSRPGSPTSVQKYKEMHHFYSGSCGRKFGSTNGTAPLTPRKTNEEIERNERKERKENVENFEKCPTSNAISRQQTEPQRLAKQITILVPQ
jgi:hypothetical protein